MSVAVSREASLTDPDSVSRETPDQTPAPVSRETKGSIPARALLTPLHAYQRFLSPALGDRCRYYPSCSAYAEQSLLELGAVRGTILAVWRLIRCNPFSKGGFDEVSDRRLFRSSGHSHTHVNGDLA